MKSFTPFQYLCIDIANKFGKDKEVFEDRIQWVKSNQHCLESYIPQADDKAQFIKAVLALRKVEQGLKTGHLISLDSTCSGVQILSAALGCKLGLEATGLIDTGERPDAYTKTTKVFNELLKMNGVKELMVARSDAKDAMMTCIYGSTQKPEEIFGKYVDTFYEAVSKVAPAAFEMLPTLVGSWDRNTLSHDWVMPDNHQVMCPVLVSGETRIQVTNLGNASFTIQYKENQAAKYGKANAANLVHSLDAMILRNMIRRCSYKEQRVRDAISLLEMSMLSKPVKVTDTGLERFLALYRDSLWIDPVVIEFITIDNVDQLPKAYVGKLLALLNEMVSYPSFDLLTVHDAFLCSPKHGDRVRYWYKEVMAELNESNVMQMLLSQLLGEPVTLNKPNLAKQIRQSNYGIG
jgi:hypothetical protein